MAHDRLAALRGPIAEAGLDGYIVPRTDEHLGECVPPSMERLAWLTGFTGSAGLALVLPGRAVLFTDGSLWEYCHIHERPLARWLDALGDRGLRIGYDPMLLGAETLRDLCGEWGRPAPVAGNLVDRLWLERQAPPARPCCSPTR